MHPFQSHFFQFPNILIDELAKHLTPTEFLLLSIIIRKTRGWHREADKISISQFMELSGIKSKATIYKALERLTRRDVGLVNAKRELGKINNYSLGWVFTDPVDNGTSIKKCTSELVAKIVTGLVSDFYTGPRQTSIKNCYSTKDINKKESTIRPLFEINCGSGLAENHAELKRWGRLVGLKPEPTECALDYRVRLSLEISKQRFDNEKPAREENPAAQTL